VFKPKRWIETGTIFYVCEQQLHILPRYISVTQIVWTPYKFWMCHKCNRSQKNLGWKGNSLSIIL